MISEVDKAYAAAIIDGEGTICCSNPDVYVPYLWVAVGMCNDVIPQWLLATFGGKCYPMNRKGEKPAWQWNITGSHSKEFLELIRPYIKLKRQQLDLGLALIELTKRRGSTPMSSHEIVMKDRIGRAMRALNAKNRPTVEPEVVEVQ